MASFVEAIGGWVVVGAGVVIVEGNHVRRGIYPNRNTCHGLVLRCRSGDGAIYLVVEESQAEEFKPGAGVRFGDVDELKGRGQLPVEAAGDVVEHSRAMEDGPVPVIPRNLFLGDVGVGYLDKGPPGAFDETVVALTLGGGEMILDLLSLIHRRHLTPISLRSKSE